MDNQDLINFTLSEDVALIDKYNHVKKMYQCGHTYVILNNTNVFGPYPKPKVSWDISEAQKVVIYNQEVAKVLTWVMTRIVINLSNIDYRTLHVLIRIATGMLNKCDIPKEYQIMFHDNMVRNLENTYNEIVLSSLPF